MKLKTQQQGQLAENLACDYLQQQGLNLIERNYHCRAGEIDLIMQHADSIVFVEVRYRSNKNFGSGADSVDFRKQKKLITTAEHYLQKNHARAQQPARFDVVSISRDNEQTPINWIQDAFQASAG